jgi:UDPglucose 6-dehydrogenase
VSAFLHISEKLGARFELLADVLRINDAQAKYFVEGIKNSMKVLRGKTIGVLGLAFKPDTDDMRSAPSIPIIQMLQKEGAHIVAYDPQAALKAAGIFRKVNYAETPYGVAHGAHAIAVLTEWSEFLNLDWMRFRKSMKDRFFFDGRNMFQPAEMKKFGFKYFSIGRPSA